MRTQEISNWYTVRQAVKNVDFAADLAGTGNRLQEVIKWHFSFMIVDNNDADLEVSNTYVRNSLLSECEWVNANAYANLNRRLGSG